MTAKMNNIQDGPTKGTEKAIKKGPQKFKQTANTGIEVSHQK